MCGHQLLETVPLDKSETVFRRGKWMDLQQVQEIGLSSDSVAYQLQSPTNERSPGGGGGPTSLRDDRGSANKSRSVNRNSWISLPWRPRLSMMCSVPLFRGCLVGVANWSLHRCWSRERT